MTLADRLVALQAQLRDQQDVLRTVQRTVYQLEGAILLAQDLLRDAANGTGEPLTEPVPAMPAS
jgi:hypothetical protein